MGSWRLRLPLRPLSRPGARLRACRRMPAAGPLRVLGIRPRSTHGPAMPPVLLRRDGAPGAAFDKFAALVRRRLVGTVLGEVRVGSRANQQICCWWNERFGLVWPWCAELLLYWNELSRA